MKKIKFNSKQYPGLVARGTVEMITAPSGKKEIEFEFTSVKAGDVDVFDFISISVMDGLKEEIIFNYEEAEPEKASDLDPRRCYAINQLLNER